MTTATTPTPPVPTEAADRLVADRRAKLRALRDAGIEPYPADHPTTCSIADLRASFDTPTGPLEGPVTVAGRVTSIRDLGGIAFVVLEQRDSSIQVIAERQDTDDGPLGFLRAYIDVGDWLGAAGTPTLSRRGEPSLAATNLTMLGKTLRPLPFGPDGLSDTERRSREREVDLTVNAASRRVFEVRHAAISALRGHLAAAGFAEVETPMLHPIPGGASARPFMTHHNALGSQMYLRIAPELYLKRLIVGGLDRVFEIGRNFRNEGMSRRHNPEFTMLEAYEAFADHEQGMALTESLVEAAARTAGGSTTVQRDGRPLDLGAPYRRASVLDLARAATDRPDLDYGMEPSELRSLAATHDVDVEASWGTGRIIVELYEALVESTLWEPTFVTEHPVETSPLAKQHRDLPHVTERYELIVAGQEMANGFSELTDPDEQRARFEDQVRARGAGDDEAMHLDEPYLRAMEHGLPPTSGLGLGVDRLVMMLSGADSIRDVILFPTLRREG